MDRCGFGGGGGAVVAEAPGYHKITPGKKIQTQLETEEIETGPGGREGRGNSRKERGGTKFSFSIFFPPLTMINAFKTGEA